MSLVFDTVKTLNYDKPMFSGVFLSQQSYINILDLVDVMFKLGMRTEACTLECLPQSYMFITYKKEKLSFGLGKNVSLKISGLGYSPKFQIVVAFVTLKNNFTENPVPHIVISKPRNMKRSDVRKWLSDSSFHMQPLHELYSVHGKIGIMLDSQEEMASIVYTNGQPVQISNNVVTRPEATISVDNSPAPTGAASGEGEEKVEFYKGKRIIQGKRGGMMIELDNGKMRYISEELYENYKRKMARKAGVVYNVNILSN